MQKINLQKELEKLLPIIEGKTLLLHSCCAPCSSYVLEYLAEYLTITLFYYNPNIAPATEYKRRLEEQITFINAQSPKYSITFLEGAYLPDTFYSTVAGLEAEPEGGKRCEACYTLRLREAASKAKELGLDYFTTTLSISPHKNSALIYQIAQEIATEYGVPALPSDFKKKGGYQRSLVLSKENNLYRQDYCGCAFSVRKTPKEEEN